MQSHDTKVVGYCIFQTFFIAPCLANLSHFVSCIKGVLLSAGLCTASVCRPDQKGGEGWGGGRGGGGGRGELLTFPEEEGSLDPEEDTPP